MHSCLSGREANIINTYSTAVIGGGASGLACAIQLNELCKTGNLKSDITVFEHLNKPAKKILATGNGRCNFCNEDIKEQYYHGDKNIISNVLSSEYADTVNFFKDLGIMTYRENGRIYPRSCQASSVRDALLNSVPENTVISDYTVSSITTDVTGGYIIDGKHFDCVVFACGGVSAKAHGTDGSAHGFIEELSHTFTELKPALTALTSNEKDLKELKGIRVNGAVTLIKNGKTFCTNKGEIQFTDKAISGIPVFDLSYLFDEKYKNELIIDTCNDLSYEQLKDFLHKQTKRNRTAEDAISGIVPRKLGYIIINRLKIKPNTGLNELNEKTVNDICNMLKNLKFTVNGTRSFDDSQVTCGGVNPKEVNPETLMSNINKGMFFCGEILPVNGDCGGYNLHFAFTTGRIAAKSVFDYLKELKNDKT